jgi:hypothetical protein
MPSPLQVGTPPTPRRIMVNVATSSPHSVCSFWLEASDYIQEGALMRDIRNDLQERARLFELEITTVNSRCKNTIEQLHKERDKRVAELNAELTSLRVLIETEEVRLANAQRAVAPGQHQYAISDFPIRKSTGL